MALQCDYCGKGRSIGHNVSHAKNRTRRLFKPNLQKLRVLHDGVKEHVKFCTSCIQRLKKYGSIGDYTKFIYHTVAVQADKKPFLTPQSPKHIDREAKKIEELLKKEVSKKVEREEKEKKADETKKVEAKKLEDLVGKK